MSETSFAGHFGNDHEVLFYEGHPPHQLKTSRMALATKNHDTLKETRLSSPEFNLFHMTSPELERLIVGQSNAMPKESATTMTTSSTINASDLNVLNFASPDFEKIFANLHGGDTHSNCNELSIATHDHHRSATGGNSRKSKVEEQREMYTKTFVEALQHMHEHKTNRSNRTKHQMSETSRGVLSEIPSSRTMIFERPEFLDLRAHAKLSESAREHMETHARHLARNSENYGEDEIEEDFPTPGSLSLAPIDLQVQEVVKRERKKQKNRVAASKCRKKKLEREAQLEVKVHQLRERNIELNTLANALRNQVTDLKQRVMEHIACGCHVTLTVTY